MSILDEPKIAGYTICRTLSTGPNGSVLLATQDVTRRQVAVKIFQPALLLDGEPERAEHHRTVKAFLTTSRMQQELARTSEFWAPVHDLGLLPEVPGMPEGAYYCTDVYPASVEWLIRGQVGMAGPTLRRLISGIAAALQELQKQQSRGHGKLTAANVLLSSRDPRSARVLLTDPSLDATPDPDADDTDDRRAIGALIYGLVTHAPVRRMMLLPLEMDEHWKALGAGGQRWLPLCNQLLSHDSSQRPGIDQIKQELSDRGPLHLSRFVRRMAVAVAALILAGAIAVASYAYAYRAACARQIAGSTVALKALVLHRNDGDLQRAIATDPALAGRLPALLDEIARTGEVGSRRPLIPSLATFHAARHASGTVGAVRDLMDERHWPLLAQVDKLRHLALSAGLKRVDTDLGRATDGLSPKGNNNDAPERLVNFLNRAPVLLQQATQLLEAWSAFTKIDDPLITSADPDAQAIAKALRAQATASTGLDAQGTRSMLAPTEAAKQLAQLISDVDSSHQYNAACKSVRVAFANDLPYGTESQLSSLYRHVRLDPHDSIEPLRAAESTDRAILASLPPTSPSWSAAKKQCDDAAARIATLADKKWIVAKQPDFNSECGRLNASLTTLATTLRTALVDDWLTKVDADFQPFSKDNTQWKLAVSGLANAAHAMAADPSQFRKFDSKREAIANWQAMLPSLDKAIQSAAALPAAFAGAVQNHRVLELRTALPAISFEESPPTPSDLVAMAMERSRWSTEIGRFAKDFPLVGSLTDLSADTVRQRWIGPKAKPDDQRFWQREVVATDGLLHGLPSLASSVSQIVDLDATLMMNRNDRIIAANNMASPKIALLARLRLDAAADIDQWPATTGELADAAVWLVKLKLHAGALELSSADFDALAQSQRQAWARFMTHAAKPYDIAAGVSAAAVMGVNLDPAATDVFTVLPFHSTASYNILVYLVRQPHPKQNINAELDLAQAITNLPADDRARAETELSRAGKELALDQLRTTINDDSWYRWPSAVFDPRAVIPEVIPKPPPVVPDSKPTDDQPKPRPRTHHVPGATGTQG